MSVTVEICVDTPDGLAAAIDGGADRIELCSALALGGLTPSPGLMRLAARAPIPVYAMIRPREGDLVFSPAELDQMRRDIDAARASGLAGVVLGACDERGHLDSEALFRLVGHAEGLGTTLHRAFDLAPDPFEALEIAASLGFERILTSGRKRQAVDALPLLADLVARAGSRIAIMPGAGIRAENVARVLAATGAGEVHGSCRSGSLPVGPAALALGFADGPSIPATSAEAVREMVAAVRLFASRPI